MCGVTLQNAELEAAREGCCSGTAAQATGRRESIRGNLYLPQFGFSNVLNVKAFVAITTRNQEFA